MTSTLLVVFLVFKQVADQKKVNAMFLLFDYKEWEICVINALADFGNLIFDSMRH